jgi:hypothetical protein
MRRLAGLVATIAILTAGSMARADVTVSIMPGPGTDFASQYGITLQELEMQLQTEIEEAFNLLRPTEYLRALGDAQAFSTKGLGVDYASNPTFISAGVAGNASVAFGDDGFDEAETDKPVAGLAVNLSIMAGMNMRVLNPKLNRLTVYLAGFHRKAGLDEMDATMSSMGVHAQYKLGRRRRPIASLFFKWGGVDLTTGFEWSRLKLRLASPLPTEVPVSGTSQGTVRYDSTGTFNFNSSTLTIPFEASTNVRFLWVVTAFGGIGTDIQMGKNDIQIDLDGTLTGIESDGTETALGTGTVTATENAGPNRGKMRFFGGLQVNAAMVKAFLQANLAPEGSFGLTFGARVAW